MNDDLVKVLKDAASVSSCATAKLHEAAISEIKLLRSEVDLKGCRVDGLLAVVERLTEVGDKLFTTLVFEKDAGKRLAAFDAWQEARRG